MKPDLMTPPSRMCAGGSGLIADSSRSASSSIVSARFAMPVKRSDWQVASRSFKVGIFRSVATSATRSLGVVLKVLILAAILSRSAICFKSFLILSLVLA